MWSSWRRCSASIACHSSGSDVPRSRFASNMEKHAGALSWSPVKVAYAELKFLLSRLVLVAGLVLLKGRLRIYRLSKAARSAHPRPSIWKPGDRDEDSRKDRRL